MADENKPDDAPQSIEEMTVNPAPPRYTKLNITFIVLHALLCLWCMFPDSDGNINSLGLIVNGLILGFRLREAYVRRNAVIKLERMIRHFHALKRIIQTPTYQYDPQTNTITFSLLFGLSPEQTDEMMQKKEVQ